ncbi:MAG TPA: PH domain-containing protein [Propionicimonas sp.]|jgi:membrane protein YdbS with pleckstrin-like domain|nr:PH domain-containing protein [Propionicimonas sp.]
MQPGLFDAPELHWQRLPARYALARMVNAALVNLLVGGLVVATAWLLPLPLPGWLPWLLTVAAVGWTLWRVVRAGRWATAFGYLERAEDLLIVRGLWTRELAAIPYGRMQSVQVNTGPVQRLWGLAGVSLVTASIQSNASIPGLPHDEATRLRDRLITAGESRALPL